MPVSFDHLRTHTRVWNGERFDMVPNAEAKALEAAGTHQIATMLSASDLKTKAELDLISDLKAQEPAAEPAEEPSKGAPKRTSRKTYSTREMRAAKASEAADS